MIPWQGGCPHRGRALAWVVRRYQAMDWPVHIGELEGPWRKAVALQRAIASAGSDTLVVADADVWCHLHQRGGTFDLSHAVDLVAGGRHRWVVPHTDVVRLDRNATAQALAGTPLDLTVGREEKPYRGRIGGGLVVMQRSLWDECPMDARFVGWGQEDESWGHALIGHAGRPHRMGGLLWHLWHPPQPRRDRSVGSAQSLDLCRRYLIAANHPDQLAALLTEARAALEEVPAWT